MRSIKVVIYIPQYLISAGNLGLLAAAERFDVPVSAHEEDLNLSDGGSMHEGAVSTRIGLQR